MHMSHNWVLTLNGVLAVLPRLCRLLAPRRLAQNLGLELEGSHRPLLLVARGTARLRVAKRITG